MPPLSIIFLLLLFTTTTVTTTASPILGLDSFLTQQSQKDPQAIKDSFLSLSSTLKNHLSSAVPPPNPTTLLSLKISVPIIVKLVGPTFSSSSPSLLSSFLTSAISSDNFHVITPFESSSSDDDDHKFSISHSLHLDVTLSPQSLSTHLSQTLKSHLSTATNSLRSPLSSVPHTLIDQIIKQDYEKEKPINGIYIYILNLGAQDKPYGYTYTPGDPSPAFTKCLGTIWTGKDRYLWIDLSAGPVDYGPALSGDGLLPKGEFHPLSAVHGGPKSEKALLSDISSLVYSAYQVLLVPSLRIPVLFENSLIIQFIHIHGSSYEPLNWKSIENTFTEENLKFNEQSLLFKNYDINYNECSICSYAISRAITSYTSRYLFDNYTLIVSEYLDSKKLHQIISESSEAFRGISNLHEEDSGRVIPVFIFDLDYNSILLLDRYHQSVAFKDIIIAVRSKNTQTVSDYSCNGRQVFTQTRELERPIIGAILQSMWGISPTHLKWSPLHNNTLVDYTWSIGQTPFGPFSEVSSLSFIQKDSAKRNVILTSLNYTITSAIDVISSISDHGGERKLLKGSKFTEFSQRWSLLNYKMKKVVTFLSHFEYETALYYLKSSDHDLYAIHNIVYKASQDLEASLVCFKDPPIPWGSISMSVMVFVAVTYVYAKRDKLFHNKRKQF